MCTCRISVSLEQVLLVIIVSIVFLFIFWLATKILPDPLNICYTGKSEERGKSDLFIFYVYVSLVLSLSGCPLQGKIGEFGKKMGKIREFYKNLSGNLQPVS